MGAVKTKMSNANELLFISKERLTEAAQYLIECGLPHKAGRIEEAIKLLSFDIWEDNTIENIKEVRSHVRTAMRGTNSHFSCRIYVEFFNGECKNFTIPNTYGYDRGSYLWAIKNRIEAELDFKLPRWDSDIPFPIELEIQAVKYSELHKGESA